MQIYMSRHGESVNNTLGIIGGDSSITENGKKYSLFLSKFFHSSPTPITIWTSSLKRTKETALHLTGTKIELNNLNEIHSGQFEELSIKNIQTYYPTIYKIRNKNKLHNRYPCGESYTDLQHRVIPSLESIDMNKNGILIIIAHQAVCRVIYSYFTKELLVNCVNKNIDLHTLYKLTKYNTFTPIQSNI